MSIFVPSSALVRQTGPSGQVLCLGTEDWFKLQTHIQAAQALPFDFAEYQTRYGDASSGTLMKEAFEAMRTLKQVADRYGSPRSLRARILQDPNILASSTRPVNDTYLATAWTLQRAHEDAAAMARTLAKLPGLMENESEADVVAGIKSLFLDTDQILDGVSRTETRLTALIKELQEIEGKLAEAQEKMQAYTTSSSKTMAFLNKEIGELGETIKKLEADRDNAWSKWLGLTIAACAAPAVIGLVGVGVMVLLAVPTGGTSFAVGAAVTGAAAGVAATALGAAASTARTTYDGLVQQIEDKSDLLRKRVLYRTDLGALDAQMRFGLPASTGVIGQLSIIRDAWKSLREDIKREVSALTRDTLSSGPWRNRVEMQAAADEWTKIDQVIRTFCINSFVDVGVIPAGSPLPADDSAWQEQLQGRLAA
jgi:hypothetical protein